LTKIILHIGGEKTGATSISAVISKNSRFVFGKFGLANPKNRPFFDDNAHFQVAAAFLDASQCNFFDSRLRRGPVELRRALDTLIARKRPRRMAHSSVGHPAQLRHGPAGIRLDQSPVPLLHKTRLRKWGPVTLRRRDFSRSNSFSRLA